MAGPLQDVKVIEFSQVVAGPVCGMLLADLGAEVIKVEPPYGDPWRGAPSRITDTESRGFIAVNRGKRGVRLDLTTDEGREIAHRLAAQADVVVINYRPDVPAKLGVDYKTLRSINPRVIYCEVSAYGSQGPESQSPGYDTLVQAMSGIMATEGMYEGGAPRPVTSTPPVDFSTGYSMAMAVSAALYRRERTGAGQKIECSLLANSLMLQGLNLTQADDHPSRMRQWVQDDLPRLRRAGFSYSEVNQMYQALRRNPGYRMYYRAYETADWAIAIGCLSEPLRKRFADLLGVHDIRFDGGHDPTAPESVEFAEDLMGRVEDIMRQRSTEEWVEALREARIPCAPVRFTEEMVDYDQALANGFILRQEHPVAGMVSQPGPVYTMSESRPEPTRPSPTSGQHTDEILRELGYTSEDIQRVRESGAAM